ncbi:ASCH domain [Cedecea davisae]|uniref:ASCH domain protein n=1 Tax=Cedecea davisae DSM 4568 TaxID=566551 RepID=S3IYN3_9ENTR|nr:ASCH domain-containing protein [Cedecea davisae]EPF17596.1 ASCH domain protein [Cedecea davisae DSM 4568]SUX27835.1 ASCH domain [Cedecea davisae]
MRKIDDLKVNYPGAIAWPFGDTPAMADELAELVVKGIKTATCCSLSSFQNEDESPTIGSYSIVLNGKGEPACVIRTIAMRIVRFCDVAEEFARKEGEGDLSLRYWREGHKEFFLREGTYHEAMELVAEEFELVEVV